MIVNNPNSLPLIATNVWTNATRTLTGLGGALVGGVGDQRVSVSNGTTTSLRPSIGTSEIVLILGNSLANVQWNLQMTNGTTTDNYNIGSSGGAAPSLAVQNNLFWLQINNGGTVAGTFDTQRIRLIS